ncbi:MAG TPA: restriction endonuclease subunit S [Desulfobulbus sp.]|nr:restriction endonuclease subunit S [Desulfobulbus sp.]
MSFPVKKLSEVTEINPRRPTIIRDDEQPTSFVPMGNVNAILGTVSQLCTEPFSKVKKGYTYFANDDVIFAKITPCMQNGKHAVVRGLIDGFGFGSTEFHVIRPTNKVISEWIYFFLRRKETLDAAVKTFTGAVGQQRVPAHFLANLELPVPPVEKQRRIAARLKAQLTEVDKARQAAEVQLQDVGNLANAIIYDSLNVNPPIKYPVAEALEEIKKGIGEEWKEYPVLGATRNGLAPAKEPPGKNPHRYKPVSPGTVFYNPMRILIGSIAFVDEDDKPGITSPDYVALKGKQEVADSRWFYYWLRSPLGEQFIKSLARGAVRERILFKRLANGEIELPSFPVQRTASTALAALKPMQQAIEGKIKEINMLPQKILSQAFDQ